MKKYIFLFLTLSFFTLFLSQKINAFGISPDKYYIDVVPGEIGSKTITVYGEAEQEGAINIYMYPYTMAKIGEGDDREFYEADRDDVNDPGNWIRLRQEFITATRASSTEITFDYVIPETALCGTNLAAIFFSSQPPEVQSSGSVVGIKSNIVEQVHFNVRGNYETYCNEAKTNLFLVEFKIDRFLPITNWDNVDFITRLENRNKFIARNPKGFIEIFGFGVDNKITIPFNDGKLDVYPDSIRQFRDTFIDPNYPKDANFFQQTLYELKNLKIGKYDVRLGITAGTTDPIVAYATLWIIPWRVVLLVIIIISILYIYFKRNRNEKKNRV